MTLLTFQFPVSGVGFGDFNDGFLIGDIPSGPNSDVRYITAALPSEDCIRYKKEAKQ